MSRIGKLPISLPEGVNFTVDNDNLVVVKGKLGELKQQVHKDIEVKVEGQQILVLRKSDEKEPRSMHGLYRSLISNMVVGVSQGFEKKLELVGVGYKATSEGQILTLSLGYSHDIAFELPKEVSVEAVTDKRANPIVTLKSFDKQLLGHVAAKIRSFRPPEPYKGKGVKFVGEQLRRKAGKAAAV